MDKKKNFTLVEIMVVVVIIAVLGSLAYPSIIDSVQKSNGSKCTSTLRMIRDAKAQHMLYNPQHGAGVLAGGAADEVAAKGTLAVYFDGATFPDEPTTGNFDAYVTDTNGSLPSCTVNGTDVDPVSGLNGEATTTVNGFHDLGL